MRRHLERFKPAAPARVHLLLAAAMWSTVGTGLLTAGVTWAWAGRSSYPTWLVPFAILAGALKGHFVLGRTAERIARRILARGDGRCVGGFLSVATWTSVALMMGSGYFLRHGVLPRAIVGLIYTAIGIALLLGSRRLWLAWRQAGI